MENTGAFRYCPILPMWNQECLLGTHDIPDVMPTNPRAAFFEKLGTCFGFRTYVVPMFWWQAESAFSF